MRSTHQGTTSSSQPRQSLGGCQGKEEEAPRAGTPRSAGPGPNTKVNRQTKMITLMTHEEQPEEKPLEKSCLKPQLESCLEDTCLKDACPENA